MSAHLPYLVLASLLFPSCQLKAQAPIQLEFLAKKEEASGCCGFFYLASDKSKNPRQVFGYEGNNIPAPIRINGELYRVSNTKFEDRPLKKGKSSIGDRLIQVWQNEKVRIELDLKTVEIGEEGTGVRGTLVITLGGAKGTYNIEGYIGS